MARNLVAVLSGLLFGLGLAVSQMVNPAKVRDFLDITGTWDPSLGFVMGGAVVVFYVAWRVSFGWPQPLYAGEFLRPVRTSILETRLVGGAAVFGVGWGMVGLCPGPSISSLAYLLPQTLVFVIAMAVSTYAGRWVLPEVEGTARGTGAG